MNEGGPTSSLGLRNISARRRLRLLHGALSNPAASDAAHAIVEEALSTRLDTSQEETLRVIDAGALLPAPHHIPKITPDEAFARQRMLAKSLDRTKLLQLYEGMLRVEAFERTLEEQYFAGKIPGPVHLYLGEEAVAVGVCSALRRSDMITSTHRGHGHAIAKAYFAQADNESGLDQHCAALFAELYGKAAGVSHGRGGSMHLYDQEATGLLGTNGFVGGGLGLATGCGLAARLKGTDGVAVAFFGDGASNHQAFHENLNMATVLKAPVIFVCENNLYATATPLRSITKNPDIASRGAAYGMRAVVVDGNDAVAVALAAQTAVEAARRGAGPTLIEARTYRIQGHHANDPQDGLYRTAKERLNWLRYAPIDRLKATVIGLGYVDNNTSEAIASKAVAKATAAAARAATATPPLPTQAHRHVWREPIHPPLPNLPSSNKPSKRQTWVAAVIDGIAEEFRRNPKSVYFGEGTGERGGSYQHTRGLWAEFGPERLIDTGISELAFTGAAMGLAACGCRAVADTMTVDFMLEAFSTLVEQAGKLRYMSGGATCVPMVMRGPAGNTKNMGPHHSGCYWPLFAHCPGLLVAIPAFAADAKGLMKTALRFTEDPVIFLEPKSQFSKEADIPSDEYYIPFGVANIVQDGDDVTLVACGSHVHTCIAVAASLSNVSCEVIDLRTLVPLDTATIIQSVTKTGRLLVVDEAYSMCGVGAEIIASVTSAAGMLEKLHTAPRRLHTVASAMPFAPSLEAAVEVTEAKVVTVIIEMLQNQAAPTDRSVPFTSVEAVTRADSTSAQEAELLAGTLPVVTPYRVGDVSYWFGIPVTVIQWLAVVGKSVAEGDPVARIRVTAEDLNKPGSTVDQEVDIVAPCQGTLASVLVPVGGTTELGKVIGTLSDCLSLR